MRRYTTSISTLYHDSAISIGHGVPCVLRRVPKSEIKVCRVVTCLKLHLSVYLSFSNVYHDRVACVCVDMRSLAT
jgi:hypothetical protein